MKDVRVIVGDSWYRVRDELMVFMEERVRVRDGGFWNGDWKVIWVSLGDWGRYPFTIRLIVFIYRPLLGMYQNGRVCPLPINTSVIVIHTNI